MESICKTKFLKDIGLNNPFSHTPSLTVIYALLLLVLQVQMCEVATTTSFSPFWNFSLCVRLQNKAVKVLFFHLNHTYTMVLIWKPICHPVSRTCLSYRLATKAGQNKCEVCVLFSDMWYRNGLNCTVITICNVTVYKIWLTGSTIPCRIQHAELKLDWSFKWRDENSETHLKAKLLRVSWFQLQPRKDLYSSKNNTAQVTY